METKRTIKLNRKFLLFIPLSFVLALLFVFIVNLIGGEISYKPDTDRYGAYNFDSRVMQLIYSTPFGSEVRKNNVQYKVGDLIDANHNKKEFIKIDCTFSSISKDFKVVAIITFVLIVIRLIYLKVNFKVE